MKSAVVGLDLKYIISLFNFCHPHRYDNIIYLIKYVYEKGANPSIIAIDGRDNRHGRCQQLLCAAFITYLISGV